ncbi:alpha/beta hydrolase [Halosimplex aquaticum]|uniref:Alpha/beta hydrolase n=1 Tax=Halosimplex aquaticum TaxID=3026162 RepID=A0ABD5Y4N0_9EURY|nr:phospholipase [Halosimplex aquaticum]
MAGPHQDQPLVTAGAPLSVADAAAVLVHGRGGTAEGIVALADEFYRHGLALVAPQAHRNRWYPGSFRAPVVSNEPGFSSALDAVGDAVETVAAAGVPADRTLLLGVSQGACVLSEFVARAPRPRGGVVLSSGGLMGPDVGEYGGSLDATPVLVCGHEGDDRVPVERLRETAVVFAALDGDVTERIHEGDGHGFTDGDLAAVDVLVADLIGGAGGRFAGDSPE